MSKQISTDITVKLPLHAIPLLRAMAELADETIEQLAARAVIHWLQSEEAMERIDEEVNIILRKL